MQALRSENWQYAKLQYEQVLQADPSNAEARQWLAVIYRQQGNSEKALQLMQGVIDDYPTNPNFHMIYGNIQKEIGNLELAIESYRKAIVLKLDFAEAIYNLGVVYAIQGNHTGAIEAFQSAVSVNPEYADAHNALGASLASLNRKAEADKAYRAALRIRPNFPAAISNLGNLLSDVAPIEALKMYTTLAQLQPNNVAPWMQMYTVLGDLGKTEEAKLCIDHVRTLGKYNSIEVLVALLLPKIMGTSQEILSNRKQLTDNLERIIAEGLVIKDPIRGNLTTNFFLAFHGINNREIQKRIAFFYQQACPSLMYVAPHCTAPKSNSTRKRIGFYSQFIAHHSVATSFSEIVNELSAIGQYDIALISRTQSNEEDVRRTYKNFQGGYVVVNEDLADARQKIASLELDILVYLDVGMDPFGYFLAFSRLAPLQCVAGGHPDTTGIPTLDYYLSADLMEPQNADEHYSEKLVRLPFGLFYFKKPVRTNIGARREDFSLPSTGSIYLCPVMLFKIHPDFDVAIEKILEKDPNGYVVFVVDIKHPTYHAMLGARFDRTIAPRVRDRVIFIPWVTGMDNFLNLIELADVVLDSFHFGIGTTGIPIFTVGTPYVTLPSDLMRGRVGLYYYKLTGMNDCIASDLNDYVEKAVRIASDPVERERIKTLILSKNNVLFENRRATQDFVDFVEQITHKQGE